MTTDGRDAVNPGLVTVVREQCLTTDAATTIAGTLSLLSEPTRLRILDALDRVEEMCVSDLARALDAGEDAVSYALRLLRTAGLVAPRKEGRVVYYRLAPDFPEPLLHHCLGRIGSLATRSAGGADA
jgi:DNA-binding transcriptional ArsR family regulator